MNIPVPIFKDKLDKISWKKIYEREYGVQYSEAAVGLLAFADYHFPVTSTAQVVIPGAGTNTAFYIDDISWVQLVEGLNGKYTSNVKKLEEYEKQFLFDGNNYLEVSKKISKLDLADLSDKEFLEVFLDHQDKKSRYSVFAWSAFILNNYVADKATNILDNYIKKHKKEAARQDFIDALFKPNKRAAILELQYEVEKFDGNLPEEEFEKLYEKFKWLSCLDIHNKPWTEEEFREHIKSFTKTDKKEPMSFDRVIEELKPAEGDLEYLKMAKSFVYIKDARDDFRRESVFYATKLWEELGKRMGISTEDTSYLQDEDILSFLNGQTKISNKDIRQRKQGFVLYIGQDKKLVCLQGDGIKKALELFKLQSEEEQIQDISGRVASKGLARGKVVIVKGIKDTEKVEEGNILVAVTTHPDYVPAMRRSSAIVTDEGGITSHAAIVSREFGIPCIVGTKVATKLLKDGDLVEVDANNGIVKKVS